MPSPGYKSPRQVKNLHASGLRITQVFSVGDIQKIKKENEGAVIARSVGTKRRLEILKKAKELNIKILNLNLDEHIKKIEEFINSKRKKEIKEAKKEEPKKEAEEKPEGAEDLSGKTKKEADKKEKDKILTKKA